MINKILNWIGGSFFRTIGRLLVYILLGFLLSYFLKDIKLPSLFNVLSPINVYARTYWPDSSDIDFKINDTILTTTSKVYTSAGNITFRAISEEGFSYLGTNDQINYGYYSVCASSKFNLTTYNSGSYSKNVKVYMTDIPCQIYNSSSYPNSRIVYITFDLNIFGNSDSMCTASVSGSTTCELNNRITIYVPTAQEWTLNSYGFASTPFEFDASQGTLINQNTTIINQNNQMINKIDSMVSSQNATKNAIDSAKNQAHSDSQAQIDNANQNTQAQIDNANQNTEDIINNQNENFNNCSNKLSAKYSHLRITSDGSYSSSNSNDGAIIDVSNYTGHYLNIKFNNLNNSSARYNYCFGSSELSSSLSNCLSYNYSNTYTNYNNILIPNNAKYLYLIGIVQDNNFNTTWVKDLEITLDEKIVCTNRIDETNNRLDNMNDTLNNSDTSEATSSASDFFSNFTTNQHGLTGIITAPLTAIQSITSKSCSPLILPLPFVNEDLELPCMRNIYDTHFSSFMQLYDIITLGIISYWVMVRIFGLVKDFKNPEHDEIEVVDL